MDGYPKMRKFALILFFILMTNDKEKEKETEKKTVRKKTGKPTRYINPLTDFGFKYLFGVKELLIDFLNGVVDVESSIVDLTYDNTERIPHSDEERIARFDLHCTTGTGERVIIEMQNNSQHFFKDRTIYYATFPIQEQAPKGKDWDYMLKPVFSVNIVNFRMKDEEPQESQPPDESEIAGKFITYVQLIDRDTGKLFFRKLTFVYIELPLLTKTEYELQSSAEKWAFILKNLPKMNELPESLRSDVFEKLFQMAEIAKLPAQERKEYYRSLKSYRDMNNSIAQRDQKIAMMSNSIAQSKQQIAMMSNSIAQRDQKIANLKQEMAAYHKEKAANEKIIADLQRQLALNSKDIN